ncbi:MAG: hydrogenase nickel incorporation protein HypB [Verrucomicrobiae bacterium]|nr:hydrogenase nickel incorporation protein HypB [Verrucomicrobiae bacterium]
MCEECGCGLENAASREATLPSDHAHPRSHSHPHPPAGPSGSAESGHGGPGEDSPEGARILSVQRHLLERNERMAERNRGFFAAKQLLVVNVLSAPGSGKTLLLEETAHRLSGRLRTGVVVGDLATDRDAARLRAAGVPVVQITTGTLCHLEADMVARAVAALDLDALDLLLIENVGNLVCPASYDLGEDLRAVLLSVTEGEDKPLKYPPLFHSADVALVTKCDLANATGFDRETALANLRQISHHARIFEVSARTGEGLADWCDHLEARRRHKASPLRPQAG